MNKVIEIKNENIESNVDGHHLMVLNLKGLRFQQ